MDFISPRVSGRVGIIHDGLVGHELPDDVGQLSRVGEIDRMGGAVDDDEDNAVLDLFCDFLNARLTWQQRITASSNDQ